MISYSGIMSIFMILITVLTCIWDDPNIHIITPYKTTICTILIYTMVNIFICGQSVSIHLNIIELNDNSITSMVIYWSIYGLYYLAIDFMIAVFIMRLHYTFKDTPYKYTCCTKLILYILYALIILFGVFQVFYEMIYFDEWLIYELIFVVLLTGFSGILCKMFIRRLNQIVSAPGLDAKQSIEIQYLIRKFTIIIVIIISSTLLRIIIDFTFWRIFGYDSPYFYIIDSMATITDSSV